MTQPKHTARGWRATGIVTVASLLAAFTPVASAQKPGLIAKLKNKVACSELHAGKQLMRNVVNSGAKHTDLMAALDELSIDPKLCAEVKDAASKLALDLSNDDAAPPLPPPPAQPSTEIEPDLATDLQSELDATAASVERMQQALIEADKRAAAMRFEVGPPPRNLTRDRAVQQ